MADFLKVERQFEEDETFEINLGNNFLIESSDRQLRNNADTEETIYRQQCEERANEYLDEADMDNLADYNCCYCKVDMLVTQWHKCKSCGQNVHGYVVGCMNEESECKNCCFSVNKGI